jgi:predicted nucleic acid-binding protein
MRIIVDTNIAFSAILNTNSKIGKVILHPKSKLNFYSTNSLKLELEKHKTKLKKLSGYSEIDFQEIYTLVINKIRFINIELIPNHIYKRALILTSKIDIDDTEFVALTEHSKGKLWTGDKQLIKGLENLNWQKTITTNDLYDLIRKLKR